MSRLERGDRDKAKKPRSRGGADSECRGWYGRNYRTFA